MSQLYQLSKLKPLGISNLKYLKFKIFLILFVITLLMIYGCEEDSGSSSEESGVSAAEPSMPSVSYAQVTLEWDPNSESDLSGYRVYVGHSSRNYQFWEDASNQTSYTVANLQSSTTYYFAATAYDIDGNESDFSEEVSCTIPPPESASSPPALSAPAVTSLPPTPLSSSTQLPNVNTSTYLSSKMEVENNLDNYLEIGALYTTIEKPQECIPEGTTKPSVSSSPLALSPKVEAENTLEDYLEMGILYAQKGKYRKAEKLFQQVVQENSFSAKAHNNLGFIYLKQENYELAEKECKEALRIDPAFVLPYYNLACLYSRKGMEVEALIYLKQALTRDERVKLWAMTDDDFVELMSDVVFQELLGISFPIPSSPTQTVVSPPLPST